MIYFRRDWFVSTSLLGHTWPSNNRLKYDKMSLHAICIYLYITHVKHMCSHMHAHFYMRWIHRHMSLNHWKESTQCDIDWRKCLTSIRFDKVLSIDVYALLLREIIFRGCFHFSKVPWCRKQYDSLCLYWKSPPPFFCFALRSEWVSNCVYQHLVVSKDIALPWFVQFWVHACRHYLHPVSLH